MLNAKIAQLVERHLAKVEVAGSNPVFRSTTMNRLFRFYFKVQAEVVELVDTLDLKSNGQQCPCGFKSRLLYKSRILGFGFFYFINRRLKSF